MLNCRAFGLSDGTCCLLLSRTLKTPPSIVSPQRALSILDGTDQSPEIAFADRRLSLLAVYQIDTLHSDGSTCRTLKYQ
ncbi:hypothetical protein DOTSEDRAFT_68302 [Dothistroma septosporum NZE10]|uniref:Uncharacterized protein n=1 Tax=Dothistroma septosporum (strain NZE10 / CBS 128990) TaxID=675120 RepID=N1Q4F4_DOTSN|nr:hypothetical protein DOTSEDRAFT_68302 [Dothistroma septosporum NZE10]